MKKYYDEKKTNEEKFNLKEGDQVLLLGWNIHTDRPPKKFEDKYFGPFKIEKKLSNLAYKLKLPHSMKVHPVFHISLLKKFIPNTISGQTVQPPPAIITPEE